MIMIKRIFLDLTFDSASIYHYFYQVLGQSLGRRFGLVSEKDGIFSL